MKLYILNENCVGAGLQADDARAYDGCGDVTVYEDSPEDLLALAHQLERHARGGRGDYDRQVAETIRDAVYDARPDLRRADEAAQNELILALAHEAGDDSPDEDIIECVRGDYDESLIRRAASGDVAALIKLRSAYGLPIIT